MPSQVDTKAILLSSSDSLLNCTTVLWGSPKQRPSRAHPHIPLSSHTTVCILGVSNETEEYVYTIRMCNIIPIKYTPIVVVYLSVFPQSICNGKAMLVYRYMGANETREHFVLAQVDWYSSFFHSTSFCKLIFDIVHREKASKLCSAIDTIPYERIVSMVQL